MTPRHGQQVRGGLPHLTNIKQMLHIIVCDARIYRSGCLTTTVMIEEGVERDGAGEGGCGAGRGYVKDGVGKWWVGFVHRFKLYNNMQE